MSRSLRAEGKRPRGSKPIPEAVRVLKPVVSLPEVRRVVHDRPVVVRCGEPYVTVSAVCKDGLRIQVRGGGQIQHIFIKCTTPLVIKELIESSSAKKRSGAFSRRSS
jgi:hypothetical protein